MLEHYDAERMKLRALQLLCGLLLIAAAAPVAAQGGEGRFTVHGFLTQGMAIADSMQVVGIPTSGTSDYRTVALQGRYAFDENASLVVQFQHRRVGASLLAATEAPVELDWAFYRHRFGRFIVRAGRVPVPMGFYNEVRDVGTVLPLFRAPFTIYPDGSEAVDGVTAATAVGVGAWELEAQAFAGGVEFKGVSHTPQGSAAYELRSDRSFGAVLLLATPITGLRGGISAISWKAGIMPADQERITVWLGSVELDRDRWMLRAERMWTKAPELNIAAGYVHGRVKITPRVHAVAQYERSDLQVDVPMEMRWTNLEDRVVGMTYALSPNVAFKLEAHNATGYGFDTFVNVLGPAARSNYGIASLSVSF